MTSRAQLKKAALGLPETEEGTHFGDALPTSIGKAATRALLAAGVRTMSDVASRPDEELLALHGMGPKAMRLLREALEARASR